MDLISMKDAAALIGDRYLRRAVADGMIIPVTLRPYSFVRADLDSLIEQRKKANRRIVRSKPRLQLMCVKKFGNSIAD